MEQFNLPQKEETIAKFWKASKIFEKSLKARAKAKRFVFFEGPPTANGRPGIHHILTRSFKDLFARYKTMQGFLVERKGGWDTHGLPVELEVEKRLGIKSKPEIEKYGIEPFNKECKKSVWGYKDEWEKMTNRMAYWLDLENPYVTYDNKYIESLWQIIAQIDKKKFLYQDYKVVPYCSRCGTSLSSHEVAQGYKKVKDPSVYVKFKITKLFGEEQKEPISFLVWTTTPWTLPANTALAIGPNIEYAQVKILKDHPETVIMAKSRIANVITDPFTIEKEFKGKDLVGAEYEPMYVFPGSTCDVNLASGEKACCFIVVGADFISTEDGSGIVHIAPAFGEDDMQTAKKNNLSVLITVNEEGKFIDEITPWAGMFVKDADASIIEDLKTKNILYRSELYEHDYPFCWRCSTPLLYYAKKTWFVRMSQLRDKLLENNSKVNWVPGHLRDGRFGEWLKEVKDWAFSRERYWGTPLPIWICQDCGEKKVVSSIDDLAKNQAPRNDYFFMRHAEAENNSKKLISSWPEVKNFKLTPKGKGQIKKAAEKIRKDLAKNKERGSGNIDIIFASDLHRTKETAEAMAKALGVKKVIFDSRLREVSFGSFNGKLAAQYHKFFKTKKDRFEYAPEGGESWNDVTKRIAEFLRRVNEKMEFKNILVISHGDPLWLLEGSIKNLDNAKQLKLKYPKVGDAWNVKYVALPMDDKGNLDLHRPYIDRVELICSNCSKKMKRVNDVVDVWFDSGAMPFAQWHYPFENKARIDKGLSFPADFICEAIDQTRGWFYTLLAVSTLLGKGAPYKNVISTGHLLDKNGQKMSKSKGNVVNPWEMMDKYGADVVRWHLYTMNPVGESKLFDEKDLQDRLRNFVMTLINTLNFYQLYGTKVAAKKSKLPSGNILDQWILSRFNLLVEEVTKNLNAYDATTSGRAINDFVDDMSNWYVRRSRSRFRDERSKDYENAAVTLRYIIVSMAKLVAPFTPFLAEYLFHSLEGHEGSVHLEDYPKVNKKLIDKELVEQMALVRKVVALGLKLRAQNQLKVRQPLATLKVRVKGGKLKSKLLELIADELNVKTVLATEEIMEDGGWKIAEEADLKVSLDIKMTNELKAEGVMRDVVRNIQDMRKDAKLTPNDIINIEYCGEGEANAIFDKFAQEIKKTVLAKNLSTGCSRENEAFKIKREFDLDFGNGKKEKIWIGIKVV